MIVKVGPCLGDCWAFIYDQQKQHPRLQQIDAELWTAMGKSFFLYATWDDKTSKWALGKPALDQGW